MENLADLAFQGILELGDDTSWADEFRNLMLFMWNNRSEILDRYAPRPLDDDHLIPVKHEQMLEENILKGLLVTLAKLWPEDDEEVPEPNAAILPLQSPRDKKRPSMRDTTKTSSSFQ
jgi:hypothetical protein